MNEEREFRNPIPHVVLDEMLKMPSDRATAIVGHALLDAEMERAIRAHFLGSSELLKALFDHPGGLAFFSAKMRIVRALNFVSHEVYCDLKVINNIRNKFAHNAVDDLNCMITFDDPEINEWITSIRSKWIDNISGWPANPNKRQYVLTVLHYTRGFYDISQSIQKPSLPLGWFDIAKPQGD